MPAPWCWWAAFGPGHSHPLAASGAVAFDILLSDGRPIGDYTLVIMGHALGRGMRGDHGHFNLGLGSTVRWMFLWLRLGAVATVGNCVGAWDVERGWAVVGKRGSEGHLWLWLQADCMAL